MISSVVVVKVQEERACTIRTRYTRANDIALGAITVNYQVDKVVCSRNGW